MPTSEGRKRKRVFCSAVALRGTSLASPILSLSSSSTLLTNADAPRYSSIPTETVIASFSVLYYILPYSNFFSFINPSLHFKFLFSQQHHVRVETR